MLVLKTGMSGFLSWVNANYNLIQSIGIIASLLLTLAGLSLTAQAAHREAKSRERDAKAKEIDNILTLADHHSNLWGEIIQKPNLQRVLREDVDALQNPATVAELVCINNAFVQYLSAWRIANAGGIITHAELAVDIKWFFALPLPNSIWEKIKGYKNKEFVLFVDRALETAGRLRQPGA